MKTRIRISCFVTAVFAIMSVSSSVWGNPVSVVGVDKTNSLARSLGLSVCQVEAIFDSASDKLLSIAFSDIITNSPIKFYQHASGDDTPPNSNLCTFFPALCLDSFVTIGVGTEGTGNDTTTLDGDWNSSLFNTGGATVGGWYNSAPPNGQGTPNPSLRVLVAQLTIRRGYGISGDVTVYYNDGMVGFPASFQCFGGSGSGFNGPSGGPEGPMQGESAGGIPIEGLSCCGDPFATDCFDPAGSLMPCCNCAACCELVCTLDPFCCEVQWDYLCISAALATCDSTLCGVVFDGPTPAGPAGESGGVGPPGGGPEGGGFCNEPCGGPVLYVDGDGDAGNDCSSWDCACDVQTALSCAGPGDQIWVAAGTYKPTTCIPPDCKSCDRAVTFLLENSVELYGGFAGTETTLEQRAGLFDQTILSGDICGNDVGHECPDGDSDCIDHGGLCVDGYCIMRDNNAENSYHVVTMANPMGNSPVLDGFTVQGGRTTEIGNNQGSAVNNIFDGVTPLLQNCTFQQNWSDNHGAVNDHGGATIIDCVFRENYQDDPAIGGAGLYIHGDLATTVSNCQFLNNVAVADGAAIYMNNSTGGPAAAATISDCVLSGNRSRYGGAMYLDDLSDPLIAGCTFSNNLAIEDGGAVYIHNPANPANPAATFLNCSLSDNRGKNGGAMYLGAYSNTMIQGCTLRSNRLRTGGDCGPGMFINPSSKPEIRDCTFVDNRHEDADKAYGGAIYTIESDTLIVNTFFQDNIARAGGAIFSGDAGGVLITPDDVSVINCTFINNETDTDGNPGQNGGGAIWANTLGSLNLTNSLFVGNRASRVCCIEPASRGGALGIPFYRPLTMANCTFVANFAQDEGGGVWLGTNGIAHTLDNCVFWDNTDNTGASDESDQIFLSGSAAATVSYSDIKDEVIDGDDPFGGAASGNLDDDPLFVGPVESGTWTANGTYDPATGQTTFADTAVPLFAAGELIGLILRPDVNEHRYAFIVANTSTTVTVWGNLEGVGLQGDPYQVNDYRLAAGSPCIDHGDNTVIPSDVADLNNNENMMERTPLDLDLTRRFFDDPATPNENGVEDPPLYLVIADMGAYEFPRCPWDLDADGDTDAADLAVLLGAWGASTCPPYAAADFNLDCSVNAADLAQLLGNWGTCS